MIHEYQSQLLFRSQGIKTAKGDVAGTPEEAIEVCNRLKPKSGDVIVKAQVLAGGRGKGHFDSGLRGGVHICRPSEAPKFARKMLGYKLFTKQTGPTGRPVSKVYICEREYIRRELYFAILMDRESRGPVIVCSKQGGMDIEQVAKDTPEDIIKVPINITTGIQEEQLEEVAEALEFEVGTIRDSAKDQIKKLYDFFVKYDAVLVEVNPFVETADKEVLCLDAKVNFDHNALFRQPELQKMRDVTQEDPREVEASKHDLNYIGLDGNIGCLVNGAGLAMATMDIIKLHGGSPANFLDVGGGATESQVKEAFRILNEDPQVRAILVNIFGGIMRCDVIAAGVIKAYRELNITLPIVIRLQGTNVEQARDLIESSGLRIIPTHNLDQAAQQAVKVAQIVDMASDVNLNVSFQLPI